MPQFKKSIIIALVTKEGEENPSAFDKFRPGITALAKKKSDLGFTYDPRSPFTAEQANLLKNEEKDTATTLYAIDAHGDKDDNFLTTLDETAQISSEQLAEYFSQALGPIKTSRTNPIHFSLVACQSVLFAQNFQKALLKRGIYSTIKARTKSVFITDKGIKKTVNEKGDDVHKAPHSKVILYIDENNQQRILDYDYNDKKLYTFTYAKNALLTDDTLALKKYLAFTSIKYSHLDHYNRLINLALNNQKIVGLIHLLNIETIRLHLTTEQQEKITQLFRQYPKPIFRIAIENQYWGVLQLLDEAAPDFAFKTTSSLPKKINILCEAHNIRHSLRAQIDDLKLLKTEANTIKIELEQEYQELGYLAFQKQYSGPNALIEFEIKKKNTSLVSCLIEKSNFVDDNSIEGQNEIVKLLFLALKVESLDTFKMILASRDMAYLTQYGHEIEDTEMTLYDYAMNDPNNPISKFILERIRNYQLKKLIAEIHSLQNDKTSSSKVPLDYIQNYLRENKDELSHFGDSKENLKKIARTCLTAAQKNYHVDALLYLRDFIATHYIKPHKTQPRTVQAHWNILQSMSFSKSEQVEEAYSEIIKIAQYAKKHPPHSFFGIGARQSETAQYIQNICEEHFDVFNLLSNTTTDLSIKSLR